MGHIHVVMDFIWNIKNYKEVYYDIVFSPREKILNLTKLKIGFHNKILVCECAMYCDVTIAKSAYILL